jgi:hypothetical protein
MLLRTPLLLLALLSYASPALAAWGENWGEMVWGASAPSAVPSMDGLGLGLLVLVLIGLAVQGLRSRATLGLMVLASLVGAADLAEAQVTIPNTFTNGEVADAAEVNANFSALANALDVTVPNSFANSGIADANQVNSNFTALKTAVDTFTNDLAAATSATDTAFTNGSAQGAASVDITTDNAAAEAVAAAAAAAGSAACTQAFGVWDAGTNTCTTLVPKDCFRAGLCGVDGLNDGSFEGITFDSSGCSLPIAGLENLYTIGTQNAAYQTAVENAGVTLPTGLQLLLCQ